jgi:hypothetical protein
LKERGVLDLTELGGRICHLLPIVFAGHLHRTLVRGSPIFSDDFNVAIVRIKLDIGPAGCEVRAGHYRGCEVGMVSAEAVFDRAELPPPLYIRTQSVAPSLVCFAEVCPLLRWTLFVSECFAM